MIMPRLIVILMALLWVPFTFADPLPGEVVEAVEAVGGSHEAQSLWDVIQATVLNNFNGLPLWFQALALIVMALVTLAAHISPHTKWDGDDWLHDKRGKFWAWLQWLFTRVAGNYKNDTNATEAKKAKARAKTEK